MAIGEPGWGPPNVGIGNKTKKTRAGASRYDHLSPYEVMGIHNDPEATRKAILNLIGVGIDEVGEDETEAFAAELVGMFVGVLRNGPG